MSLLLYGIISSDPDPPRTGSWRLPRGVDGAPVYLVEAGTLRAIVSRVVRSTATATIARALAYARVVDAVHADRAIVPMRYGCVVREARQVVELLHTRAEEYARMLQAVDGCVEMGIRLLVDRAEPATHATFPLDDVRVPGGVFARGAGMAYLARRQQIYDDQDRKAREVEAQLERLRAVFAEWFVRCRAECPPAAPVGQVFPAHAFALHFLLKREWLPSFRQAFRRIDRAERSRLLLSGPWPPYNFVGPERVANSFTDLQL
jgi:hypothetical protein